MVETSWQGCLPPGLQVEDRLDLLQAQVQRLGAPDEVQDGEIPATTEGALNLSMKVSILMVSMIGVLLFYLVLCWACCRMSQIGSPRRP